jgi:arabinofuranosyltransferase
MWVALCAGLFWVHASFYAGTLVDDPLISYRYARNWVAGEGLVFNPGERVEGYSNFLHVALIAGGILLGVSPLDLGPAIAMVSALAVLLFLVLRHGKRFAPRKGTAALLLAASGPFCFWPPRGLETALYGALVFFGIWLAGSASSQGATRPGRKWLAAWLFLCLAGLARIEGPMFCLLAGCWGLSVFLRRRRELPAGWKAGFWGGSLAALAVLGAYHAWRLSYFGRPFPNTFYAKATGPLGERLASGAQYVVGSFGVDCLALIALWLLCGAALLVWPWKDASASSETAVEGRLLTGQRGLFAAAVAWQALFAVWVGGDWMPLGRFAAPVVPLMAALAEDAWLGLLGHLERRPNRRDALAGALAALIVAGLWLEIRQTGDTMRVHRQGRLAQSTEQLAQWMGDRLPHDRVVAGEEAGLIPWFSGLRFLDMHGLVTRQIADRPGGLHHKHDADWILSQRPDYIALLTVPQDKLDPATLKATHDASGEIIKRPAFWENYELLRRQPRGSALAHRLDVLLFQRKDLAGGDQR